MKLYVPIFLVLLVIASNSSLFASAIIVIGPPTSNSDYQRLASLIVSTFDAPTDSNNPSSIEAKLQNVQWDLFEKALTEDFTYRQYVSTARRMRGKKYCLLLAKEYASEEESLKGVYAVVGMVEMGLSICPTVTCLDLDEIVAGDSSEDCEVMPQPTIGFLCTKSSHRNRGIGLSLVQKCEEIAQDVWNEQHVFVDVDPNNFKAISFFERADYEYVLEERSKTFMMRNTTVFRRRVEQVKPHFLLRKRLYGETLS